MVPMTFCSFIAARPPCRLSGTLVIARCTTASAPSSAIASVAARASARIRSTPSSRPSRRAGGSCGSRPTTRSIRGSAARRAATRAPRYRLTPVTTTTLGGEVTTSAPFDAEPRKVLGRRRRQPGDPPGLPSLAQTATLDAGLAQQLAVLLLRHTLAALLDHGAHTKASRTMFGWNRAGLHGTAGTELDGTRTGAANGGARESREPTGPAYRPAP